MRCSENFPSKVGCPFAGVISVDRWIAGAWLRQGQAWSYEVRCG